MTWGKALAFLMDNIARATDLEKMTFAKKKLLADLGRKLVRNSSLCLFLFLSSSSKKSYTYIRGSEHPGEYPLWGDNVGLFYNIGTMLPIPEYPGNECAIR